MRQPVALALLSLLAAQSLPAQVNWTRLATSGPPARWARGNLVADRARNRLVLWGGDTGSTYLNDTWEFVAGAWQQRSPATRPAGRTGLFMVYDGARQRTVLFGGLTATQTVADTWEWDGTNWTLRAPANSPPARSGHAMAYDSGRQRIVLFGGALGTIRYADTWEFDGANWVQRQVAGPPGRFRHGMAYDSARSRVVIFGGDNGAMLNDTWEFDGNTWQPWSGGSAPVGRSGHAMAFDTARSRTVLVGGYDGARNLAETWEFDGTAWLLRTPGQSPTARNWHSMAYDAAAGRTVLFGGNGPLGDTWQYAPINPASYAPFGTACSGAGLAPTLGAQAPSLPWLGTTLITAATNLALADAAILMVGTQIPPLDLTASGMTACTLHVDPMVSWLGANVAGTARWSIPVPTQSSLLGTALVTQAAVARPGANPLGVLTSNACEMRLGAR